MSGYSRARHTGGGKKVLLFHQLKLIAVTSFLNPESVTNRKESLNSLFVALRFWGHSQEEAHLSSRIGLATLLCACWWAARILEWTAHRVFEKSGSLHDKICWWPATQPRQTLVFFCVSNLILKHKPTFWVNVFCASNPNSFNWICLC